MLDMKAGHSAWGAYLDTILREPSEAELAALTPEIPEEDRDKVTVGEIEKRAKDAWFERQKEEVIWLLIKETAYARRNEHHQITKIFSNDELGAISPETKAGLKRRFEELNAVVKGKQDNGETTN